MASINYHLSSSIFDLIAILLSSLYLGDVNR